MNHARDNTMHVAVVDPDVSYPPTSGKRLRTLNLLLQLATRHRITYLARSGQTHDDTQVAHRFLVDHGIDPIIVHDPLPTRRGLGFYGRLAANVGSRWPYSVAIHQSRKLADAILRCAQENPIDLWQFEWTSYLMQVGHHLRAPKLLMAHNVDSLIWQRYHEVETNPLRKWYIGRQWAKFRRFEREAFARASCVVAVSPQDADLMRAAFDASHVEVVDNGVDCEYFSHITESRQPHQVLFLGALDWRPNQDGVRFLLDEIWPRVVAEIPAAQLVIVGRHPPSWLADQIRGQTQVILHADVPDVRPYLARSTMMIVPLRIGGGSRLKILEALASNLPVISTRVGAEGLSLTAGIDWTEANTATELAAALVNGLRNPTLWQQQASAGRQIVRQKYDWSMLADRLDQIWQSCAGIGC